MLKHKDTFTELGIIFSVVIIWMIGLYILISMANTALLEVFAFLAGCGWTATFAAALSILHKKGHL